MRIQYGIKSLLLATLFLSLLLSICCVSGALTRGPYAYWLSNHPYLYVIVTHFSFAAAPLFWLALLTPCWLPALFATAASKWERLSPFLNLVPAAWYIVLISLHESTLIVFWCAATKTFAVVGTVAAIGVLCMTARRGLYVFSVPIAFAIVSGTVWLLAAFP